MNFHSSPYIGRSTSVSVSRSLMYLILISLATAPAFALGEGNRNLLLIGVMAFLPLVILVVPRFYRSDIWLILLMSSIIVIPLVHQPQSMRWSTVLYSCMFCFAFMAYNRLLHITDFSIKQYSRLLKYLILAYFIVLLIQQFCVLTGLPIFNLGTYDPETPWSLNSLSAEVSHSARIVALLMYCYIISKELILGRGYNIRHNLKSDRWVWAAFIWTMVTMGSATAFLFIFVVLIKFVRGKNLVSLLFVISLIFVLVEWMGITVYTRTIDTILATITLEKDAIIRADHSASVRIIPIIICAKMIDLSSWNGWFGHGIDYVSSFMHTLVPGVPEGFSGGGLFQIWLEYGFISFALFFTFSLKKTVYKQGYLNIIFWFFLVFMYGINNQIVWLCITLLYTNKFFLNKKND